MEDMFIIRLTVEVVPPTILDVPSMPHLQVVVEVGALVAGALVAGALVGGQ
jgi:hypothetical protein